MCRRRVGCIESFVVKQPHSVHVFEGKDCLHTRSSPVRSTSCRARRQQCSACVHNPDTSRCRRIEVKEGGGLRADRGVGQGLHRRERDVWTLLQRTNAHDKHLGLLPHASRVDCALALHARRSISGVRCMPGQLVRRRWPACSPTPVAAEVSGHPQVLSSVFVHVPVHFWHLTRPRARLLLFSCVRGRVRASYTWPLTVMYSAK